jgi:hypothetical protein
MEQRARQSLASISGVSGELAETLFQLGWRSAAEVASAKPDELASVQGVGGGEQAKTIIGAAATAAEVERAARQAEEAARAAKEAAAAAAPVEEAAASPEVRS